MTTLTVSYVDIGWAFLSKAEAALAQGNLVQASRKGWCAAAWALRGFAQAKGWRYTGFRRLYAVLDRLVEDYGAAELDSLFDSVIALEINGPRCCDSRAGIEYDLRRVAELLRKLTNLPP